MKVSPLVLAAAIAGSAVAQQRSEYFPKCALDCLDQGTKKATDCSLDDAVCWCVQKNYENIYDASLACVLKDCGADKSVGTFSYPKSHPNCFIDFQSDQVHLF